MVQRKSILDDMLVAKETFQDHGLALIIVKDKMVLHKSKEARLLPLAKALLQLGAAAAGSAVADKVIGRAAAMLLVSADIAQVYTPLISRGAAVLLSNAGISWAADKTVPSILNGNQDQLCPMEQLVSSIQDAELGRRQIMGFFKGKGLLPGAAEDLLG